MFDNDNIVPVLKRYKHIFGLAFASALLIITFVPFNNIASSSINTRAPPPSADPDGYAIPTGTLRVIKEVRGGGPLNPGDWQLRVRLFNETITFQGSSTGQLITRTPGTFQVEETSPPGSNNYRTSFEGDGCNGVNSGTIVAGEDKECRVINTYQPTTPTSGTLTVIKQVRGGGPLQPQNWQLQVVPAGTNPTASITPSTSFQGSLAGTSVTVGPGGFRVLEVSPFPPGDANYRRSFEGNGCNATMVAGQNLECRVVNTYQPPTPGTGTLTVIKHVIGGNRDASDFTIRIGAGANSQNIAGRESGENILLPVGTRFTVTEPTIPSGYSKSPFFDGECSGTITADHTNICIIWNIATPPTPGTGELLVIKHVINNDGGNKRASDFDMRVRGTYSFDFTGRESGTIIRLPAGSSYSVSEGPHPGYNLRLRGNCGVSTIANNDIRVCIAENDDIRLPPSPPPPCRPITVDTETIRLGKGNFPAGQIISLADAQPLSIIGGHVMMNIPSAPTTVSSSLRIIVADLSTGRPPFHLIALPLVKVVDVRSGEVLYHLDLRPTMTGTNPITGRTDTVSHITKLLLWNSGTLNIAFGDDHQVTTTLMISQTAIPLSTDVCPWTDIETIPLGKSFFSANGMRPLADVAPFHLTGGHVMMSIPTSSASNIKIIAADLRGGGAPLHAVALNPVKVVDVRSGEVLYHLDLRPTMTGTNPITGRTDTVSTYTDVLIWNADKTKGIAFDDDNQITVTLTADR